MEMLTRISGTISRISAKLVEIILISMVLVMAILVIMQVLLRYFFSSAFSWTEEIARYMMIWVSFLGAGLALRQGLHIGVQALVMRLSARKRRWVSITSKIAVLFFLIVLTLGGFQLAWFVRNQSSPALFLSMSWAYGAAAAGGLFMAIQMCHLLATDIVLYGSKEEK
ncbi:MAG: TRAP transporter small permease [Desulfobacterales bacterium]